MILNLFYQEPDPDRWFPLDRYPRRVIRRLVRGKPQPGGQTRVFLNLCAGLDQIGIDYRVNDFYYAKRNPRELACIIGKPQVLDSIPWRNPILFGAAVFSHPLDDPNLLHRLAVRRVLVPGGWMRRMCEPYWGNKVAAWPVGIDTEAWGLTDASLKTVDFLLYDKVRWNHNVFDTSLIQPIRDQLTERKMTFREIRYGSYREAEFHQLLKQCRAMIFLCEHETQGIAYQQALASGVPILAWDRGGFWQDPAYYPHAVQFQPVSSVPYWDERCGTKFTHADEFPSCLSEFWETYLRGGFDPRSFVLDNLTLKQCASSYLEFVRESSES
jgi:hypothetical protein